MGIQEILCAICIIFSIVGTVLLMINAKTMRFKLIKNNTLTALVCSIPLITIAIVMIFIGNINTIKYILCITSAFSFPIMMVIIVTIYEKILKITKAVDKIESENQQAKGDKTGNDNHQK